MEWKGVHSEYLNVVYHYVRLLLYGINFLANLVDCEKIRKFFILLFITVVVVISFGNGFQGLSTI